jgi:hypothetical protein
MIYRLRAECRADAEKLAATLAQTACRVSGWVVAPAFDGHPFPDVDIVFETDESLAVLRILIGTTPDGHVMGETIAPSHEYTGERTYEEPPPWGLA